MLAAFLPTFLSVLFVIICVLLIVVVLLQKGRGGGLGAALGGMGTSAFGTRTGDVFTWVTIVLVAGFILMAIGTSLAYRPDTGTVDTPEFNPPAMEISGETRVQIFTPLTRNTEIHYTIDGSTPDEDSPMIGNGSFIMVQPGDRVRARAYRTKWNPSPVSPEQYYPLAQPDTQPADPNETADPNSELAPPDVDLPEGPGDLPE